MNKMKPMEDKRGTMDNPIAPFYYSAEHDQGMGVPSCCGQCQGPLILRPLGWTCEDCGCGYGRADR
jgi:hypothetical protein